MCRREWEMDFAGGCWRVWQRQEGRRLDRPPGLRRRLGRALCSVSGAMTDSCGGCTQVVSDPLCIVRGLVFHLPLLGAWGVPLPYGRSIGGDVVRLNPGGRVWRRPSSWEFRTA